MVLMLVLDQLKELFYQLSIYELSKSVFAHNNNKINFFLVRVC